jgi:hypothetical protein
MAVSGTMLIGQEKLAARLSVLDKEMTQRTAEALRKAGGEIIRVAIPKTPIATGELRARSFNEGPLQEGDKHIQVVGFEKFVGGKTEMEPYGTKNKKAKGKAYAVPVHENLEAHHDVGEAKFLEHGVQETESYLLKYLAKEMKL